MAAMRASGGDATQTGLGIGDADAGGMMTQTVPMRLKQTARGLLPRPVLFRLRDLGTRLALARSGAAEAFEGAVAGPSWLGMADLHRLHREMPPAGANGADALARLHASYTDEALAHRGEVRARQLQRALGAAARHVKRSLELGCGEGMVSRELAQRGVRASGIDIRGDVFDARAVRAGADLQAMDAGSLAFDDGTFDLVFSFDAFEHFPNPATVLDEATRVLRPGGLLYLDFGPLYDSAWGLHADAVLGIPHVQHLFPRDAIERFCREERLPVIHFDQCNGWPLGRYRRLFASRVRSLDTLFLLEKLDVSGLHLIERYPSCFRAKVADLEGLLVGYVEALFRKREG
jgi:SAM-dependent methyltransferase